MSFNEANTIEAAIIKDASNAFGSEGWKFVHGPDLPRQRSEILLEDNLHKSLCRLNPSISGNPDYADEVIHKLRGVLMEARHTGMIRANEMFTAWLLGEHSMPFGKNHEHVPVCLIDFENPGNNQFIISQQVTYKPAPSVEKRFDIVFYVNGIPLMVGEVKTPVRPSVSWADGAKDFLDDYWKTVPDFFVPNLMCFATEGKELRYAPIGGPYKVWAPWRETEEREEKPKTLEEVLESVRLLMKPNTILELLESFHVFATDDNGRKIKVLARYPQYEAAKQIVERVVDGTIKQGLIWHFQGSGKSLLMVFAARMLKARNDLYNPTVIIVVDRKDLNTQIGATFDASDVPGVVKAGSRKELQKLLKEDTRQILITTVHKFGEAEGVLNERPNIILMVDEAHRTQEGDLGRKMREALPKAFFFGLTGTPISRHDRNTFKWFGAEEDEGRYLNHYSYRQSIRDGATLPVKFEPRLVELQIDQDAIDEEFEQFTQEQELDDNEKIELSRRAGKLAHLLKAPKRMTKIADDIAGHFKTRVDVAGFKGMVVVYDREACVMMKELLDQRLGAEASEVVMIINEQDRSTWGKRGIDVTQEKFDFWRELDKNDAAQKKLIDRYKRADDPLKLLIVTNKLLTGFDAPICQVMYLDKPLRDHNLLQAICRTNRLFNDDKDHGLIVDYLGVFNNMAKALDYDPKLVERVVTNLDEIIEAFPELLETCLAYFPGVDRTVFGYEGLMAAQDCIKTNEQRDAFGADFGVLSRAWEAINPHPMLSQYEKDYRWLAEVYQSLQPPSGVGKLLWQSLGPKTLELIHRHVSVDEEIQELAELTIDDTAVLELDEKEAKKKARRIEIDLISRIRRKNDPRWEDLGERLERLREEYEQGLYDSVEWLKRLLELAREFVQAEHETEEEVIPNGKQALGTIFEDCKVDTTPEIVAKVVDDIDNIVKATRFDGWQDTVTGERDIKRALRSTLHKYQLHREQELFDKAYAYIREHY